MFSFSPGLFSGGQAGSSAASIWTFDQGSGSVAPDSRGVLNLNLTSGSWGSGYYALPGNASGGYAEAASNTYWDLTDFTVFQWFQLLALPGLFTSDYTLMLGSGSSASFQLSITDLLGYDGMYFTVFGASGNTSVITPFSFSINTTDIFFMAATYRRIGGSGNNIMTLYGGAQGGTLISTNSTTAVLMSQNSSFSLRSKPSSASTDGANFRLYRQELFTRTLPQSEIETIFTNEDF